MKLTDAAKTIKTAIKGLVRPTKNGSVVLDAIARAAQQGDLPYACYHAAYGIAWSLGTGRLDGRRHVALQGLGFVALIDLVATIAFQDLVTADVPRWLNEHFDPA